MVDDKCVELFARKQNTWEQRKLGEVIERFEYGLNASAIDYDGVHKYIRITDIDDVSHKFLDSNLTTPKINFQNADTEMYKLKEGDILFARTGASVGKTYLYNLNDGDLYFAGFLIRGHVTSSNNANFVYQNTLTDNYDLFIKITSQRSGQPGVNSKEYAEFKLYIPSKAEQDKISTVLTDLDNLITLHQRKLNKLEKLKKAYLEELFPTGNQCKPKRRFKEFKDDWEQRKLSEFVDKAVDNRGKTPPLDENGPHPLIEVAALGEVYPDYSKVEKYLSDDIFNTNLRAYIKQDDILFTTVGSIGLVSLMDSREEAAIAQNIVAFRAKENFLPEYLYALFSNEDNQYKAKRIAMVAVQPSIKVSQLVNVEYMISTNIEEQERIGVFFSSLQNLITLHKRKLEKLKKLKAAYLDELFV